MYVVLSAGTEENEHVRSDSPKLQGNTVCASENISDWTTYTPSNLKSPISEQLKIKKGKNHGGISSE